MALEIDRRQVMAYRIAVQQLDRSGTDLGKLAVLDLGLPDVNGTAQLAVSARLATDTPPDLSSLVRIWSFRGAPYYHGRPASGSSPVSCGRSARRTRSPAGLAAQAGRGSGTSALDALTEVAGAMLAEVSAARHPLTKGVLSAAVTARIRPELSWWCAGCKATHVSEQLMRLGGLPAGARLDFGSSPLSVSALPRWSGLPAKAAGVARILDAYFRLYGPATPADLAGYLGTSRTAIMPSWPENLVEVEVSGRKSWLPEKLVDAVRAVKPAPMVRLLGAGDPYLQSRDRDLLVPDKVAQKESGGFSAIPARCWSTARSSAPGGRNRPASRGPSSPSPSSASSTRTPATRSPTRRGGSPPSGQSRRTRHLRRRLTTRFRRCISLPTPNNEALPAIQTNPGAGGLPHRRTVHIGQFDSGEVTYGGGGLHPQRRVRVGEYGQDRRGCLGRGLRAGRELAQRALRVSLQSRRVRSGRGDHYLPRRMYRHRVRGPDRVSRPLAMAAVGPAAVSSCAQAWGPWDHPSTAPCWATWQPNSAIGGNPRSDIGIPGIRKISGASIGPG